MEIRIKPVAPRRRKQNESRSRSRQLQGERGRQNRHLSFVFILLFHHYPYVVSLTDPVQNRDECRMLPFADRKDVFSVFNVQTTASTFAPRTIELPV